MKAEIHPEYTTVKVVCVCGNTFETGSTMGKEIHTEICSECHPFFTGKQKLVDTAGRVERFRRKYNLEVPAEEAEDNKKAAAAAAAAKAASAETASSEAASSEESTDASS